MSDFLKKVKITGEEKANRVIALKETYYKTDFVFLRKHNGYRKNKIHVFMGVAGGGKSTLRNSLIKDFLICNPSLKVFLYLSEESEDEFYNDLARTLDHELFNDRVCFFSEADMLAEGVVPTQQEALEQLVVSAMRAKADIIFFDNLTTSRVYGGQFEEQEMAIRFLKPSLIKLNIPSVFFTHTGKSIRRGNKELIDVNDARGTASLPNIAEFFYIMQTFKADEDVRTTIRIDKHRGYTVKEIYHCLEYDEKQKLYTSDRGVSFEYINGLHKNQDKLGRKSGSDSWSSEDRSGESGQRGQGKQNNFGSRRQSEWFK